MIWEEWICVVPDCGLPASEDDLCRFHFDDMLEDEYNSLRLVESDERAS